MSADGSATVFFCTPLRIPASEVGKVPAPPLPNAKPDTRTSLTCSAPPLPTEPCLVCPRFAQEFEPYRQAAYWKAQHQRACQREEKLQQRIDELEAKLRLREQQLFGSKTETSAATMPTPPITRSVADHPRRPPGDALQLLAALGILAVQLGGAPVEIGPALVQGLRAVFDALELFVKPLLAVGETGFAALEITAQLAHLVLDRADFLFDFAAALGGLLSFLTGPLENPG